MYYPVIDPIIVSVSPLALRWYGLMYLLGFAAAYLLGKRRIAKQPGQWSVQQLSDLVFYGALGAVLGGRVGYVLFYNFAVFADDPLYLFRVWEGGMSFHGGFLGVLVVLFGFARKTDKDLISVMDFLAPLCPLGLGLGRIGNFINMELPGRVTDGGLGFYYKCQAVYGLNPMCIGEWESVLRHPSSLYQSFTEGVLLFCLLWWISARPQPKGLITGAFLLGYGSCRFATEFFRSPDAHIGFVIMEFVSMGQLLSLPMIIVGAWMIIRARQSAIR